MRRLNAVGSNVEDLARYSYGGKELDDDTNLYYFNARYYDASTGRFINVDPIQDGSNWYVYCSNNPLNYVDPTGLSEVEGHSLDGSQVYDAYGTKSIVSSPDIRSEALARNGSVFYWAHKEPSTFQVGVSVTAGAGPMMTGGGGYSDAEGGESYQEGNYKFVGAGEMIGASVSVTLDFTSSSNDDLQSIDGPLQIIGGSFSIGPITLGLENGYPIGSSECEVFTTFSIGFGIGTPEVHYYVSETASNKKCEQD